MIGYTSIDGASALAMASALGNTYARLAAILIFSSWLIFGPDFQSSNHHFGVSEMIRCPEVRA